MQLIEKINHKNYRIDLTTRQITMLDNRFYYSESGNHVPSITTILNAYPKDSGYYEWLKRVGEDADSIRDEAGRRGSVVHDLTEKYDAGIEVSLIDEAGNINLKMSEWNMLEKYCEFRDRTKWNILHSEMNMVSETLGYAGTLDRIFEVDGKKILIDIKTSNAIYAHYALQLAAYRELCKENFAPGYIDEVAILWLNAKTRTDGKKDTIQGVGWQLIRYTEEECIKALRLFNATKELWIAENGSMKPRQMVYQLSHKL